jgi:hypothetical protein
MIEWTMHGYLPLDFFLIILFFSPLSVVLKYFNHILVATHKLATSVLHSGVRETAFHHDLS